MTHPASTRPTATRPTGTRPTGTRRGHPSWRLRALALASGAILAPLPARADPWVPAAGTGEIKPMLRYFDANTAFSPTGGFTSNTVSGPTETETQIRITGEHGLGHGFSLEYDLRDGFLRKTRVKGKKDITTSAAGLRDQEIGLNYGLTQRPDFADSVTFNVVLPTGTAGSLPALGTGRWAVEPDFQIGTRFAGGHAHLTGTFGPRIFLDGLTTQLRGTVGIGVSPLRGLTLSATAFYVRTVVQRHSIPVAADGELYNVFRLGGTISYRLTPRFAPFFEYERYLAGKRIHAGERFVLGVAIKY